jgi:hypothetical protein
LAAVVLLVIEKTGSQVFLLSSTPLMPPYIVKMTWSRPKINALSTEDFIFIWFLANAATKFQLSVIQWARKRFVMTFFLKILNTYNCHNSLIFLHVII